MVSPVKNEILCWSSSKLNHIKFSCCFLRFFCYPLLFFFLTNILFNSILMVGRLGLQMMEKPLKP